MEVVFELALVAVVDEVDAVVDARVPDLRVVRHVRAPLRGVVADEVVALAGQRLDARDLGPPVRADQPYPNDRAPRSGARRLAPAHRQHGLVPGEKERVAAAPRGEL